MSMEVASVIESSIPSHPTPKYPSLLEYGAAILQTHDSNEKADLTTEAFELFHQHNLPVGNHQQPPAVLDYPARPKNLEIVPMFAIPSKVKNEELNTRIIRLIHSQAHIESYAIDISWDVMVRFAAWNHNGAFFPRDFFVDWLKVANDEARHFQIWDRRLLDYGSHYGALPTHDGLWESCFNTKDNILARFSLLNLILEAHGCDCSKRIASQFNGCGDKISAKFIQAIEKDEITHVAAGVRWFKFVCELQQKDPIPMFHQMVRDYFHGTPKPPFNHEARLAAGLTAEWYEPLVHIKPTVQTKLNIKELMANRQKKKEDGTTEDEVEKSNVVEKSNTQEEKPEIQDNIQPTASQEPQPNVQE